MTDKTILLDGAAISHGPLGDRVYVLTFPDICGEKTADKCERLAEENGYSKIIAKVSERNTDMFIKRGFEAEASMPLQNSPWKQAVFVSKFYTEERRQDKHAETSSEILRKALRRKKEESAPALLRQCEPMTAEDAKEMAALYGKVFDSYPFPVYDPSYIKETMKESVLYFGIRTENKIIALASAEINSHINAAEMTDFATLPEARGKGCASALLVKMENELPKRGITSFFTIARSLSAGMNITFAARGYGFGGKLVNNTNICGGVESMNLWHKQAER